LIQLLVSIYIREDKIALRSGSSPELRLSVMTRNLLRFHYFNFLSPLNHQSFSRPKESNSKRNSHAIFSNIQQYLLMSSIIWEDSVDGVDPGNNTATIFWMHLGLK
jgi:hypothetical protein